jgi:hypothetical protein
MARPPAKKLPPVVLAFMAAGAVVFAATGTFVVAPALFPRRPGAFAVAPILVAGVLGMFGGLVGVGLGSRLFMRK